MPRRRPAGRLASLLSLSCCLAASLLSATPARGQARTLDLLDGETLYDGGWLVTVSHQTETRDQFRAGRHKTKDPLRREAELRDTVLALHHGLRHDLQLSLIVPHVDRSLRLRPKGGAKTRISADGLGDVTAVAKWRFHRWDAPHIAWNNSLILGIEAPTGDDEVTDKGLLLPPDLQPGRGSWNPLLGVASTYEPGRWRFNAVALYTHGGGGGAEETGDSLFAEVSVGNRFWLQPYPGPFMRADLSLRHHREERVHVRGDYLTGPPISSDPKRRASGGELTSLALNWAFRPRPSLDIQLEVETPLWQDLAGQDLGASTSISLSVGYRF